MSRFLSNLALRGAGLATVANRPLQAPLPSGQGGSMATPPLSNAPAPLHGSYHDLNALPARNRIPAAAPPSGVGSASDRSPNRTRTAELSAHEPPSRRAESRKAQSPTMPGSGEPSLPAETARPAIEVRSVDGAHEPRAAGEVVIAPPSEAEVLSFDVARRTSSDKVVASLHETLSRDVSPAGADRRGVHPTDPEPPPEDSSRKAKAAESPTYTPPLDTVQAVSPPQPGWIEPDGPAAQSESAVPLSKNPDTATGPSQHLSSPSASLPSDPRAPDPATRPSPVSSSDRSGIPGHAKPGIPRRASPSGGAEGRPPKTHSLARRSAPDPISAGRQVASESPIPESTVGTPGAEASTRTPPTHLETRSPLVSDTAGLNQPEAIRLQPEARGAAYGKLSQRAEANAAPPPQPTREPPAPAEETVVKPVRVRQAEPKDRQGSRAPIGSVTPRQPAVEAERRLERWLAPSSPRRDEQLVQVRIGKIEVVAPPESPVHVAPPHRSAPQGFDAFAAIRSYTSWETIGGPS